MGNELKNQLDEFGKSLKKPQDPNKPKPHPRIPFSLFQLTNNYRNCHC